MYLRDCWNIATLPSGLVIRDGSSQDLRKMKHAQRGLASWLQVSLMPSRVLSSALQRRQGSSRNTIWTRYGIDARFGHILKLSQEPSGLTFSNVLQHVNFQKLWQYRPPAACCVERFLDLANLTASLVPGLQAEEVDHRGSTMFFPQSPSKPILLWVKFTRLYLLTNDHTLTD